MKRIMYLLSLAIGTGILLISGYILAQKQYTSNIKPNVPGISVLGHDFGQPFLRLDIAELGVLSGEDQLSPLGVGTDYSSNNEADMNDDDTTLTVQGNEDNENHSYLESISDDINED